MRLNATARNAALCLGLSTAGTLAGPLDGVYVPNPSGRAPDRSGCETVAILIAEDRLRYFEVRCALSKPVQIRAMEALLYDGQCSLDGSAKQGRVLIRRMASGDVAVVTPFMDMRLAACEVAG